LNNHGLGASFVRHLIRSIPYEILPGIPKNGVLNHPSNAVMVNSKRHNFCLPLLQSFLKKIFNFAGDFV